MKRLANLTPHMRRLRNERRAVEAGRVPCVPKVILKAPALSIHTPEGWAAHCKAARAKARGK